jgi:protein-S-isoprenylcysteine O-methyltransferase Ste14
LDPAGIASALLEAAWISARIATGFAFVLAFGGMVAVILVTRREAVQAGPPRAHRTGAAPRIAAQLGAVVLGALVTAFTRGQAQAWLPAPAQAAIATLAALAVLFAGTFIAWAAWSLGTSFTHEAIVPARARLVTQGPFALVRHPFYAAWGLFGAGAALAFGSFAGAVVFLAAWIPAMRWRAALEEEALAEAWPGEWPAYAARTPRFLPRW